MPHGNAHATDHRPNGIATWSAPLVTETELSSEEMAGLHAIDLLFGAFTQQRHGRFARSVATMRWAPRARSSQMRSWTPGNSSRSLHGRWNVYFSVNAATEKRSKKASKDDICEVLWLHVDADLDKRLNWSAPAAVEAEKDRVLARAARVSIPCRQRSFGQVAAIKRTGGLVGNHPRQWRPGS